ncbi:MAG: DUF3999 family protein [Caldimonas sp.]
MALVAWAAFAPTATVFAEPAPMRYSAPIEIRTPAPFVQVELPTDVYARVERPDLADLRIVDARGERAPFALLEPRASLRSSELLREAALFALPARPTAAGVWPSPVDVVVEGDRISVRRHGGATPPTTVAAARESGGWLLDLGPARAGDSPSRSLRMRWSGPAEFSAAYRIETSDDLLEWRRAGSGQLMALQSAAGSLAQAIVPLPDGPARFVRLLWADAAAAPAIDGASVLAREQHLVALDGPREITVAASAEPAGRTPLDEVARRAVHFDLGAALPIVDLELRFLAGTHVAPVRLQGRVRVDEPWRELGAGVFYRLERGGSVGESPAIAVPATVRFVRVVGDDRAAAIAPADARLVVHARLASLVFAAQGQAPFRVLAGSKDAAAGALPARTLVPSLDDERPRFGLGVVGAFSVDEAAAREVARAGQAARWRPWLLWSVLLAGVAVLGALVWRLARSDPAAGSPAGDRAS